MQLVSQKLVQHVPSHTCVRICCFLLVVVGVWILYPRSLKGAQRVERLGSRTLASGMAEVLRCGCGDREGRESEGEIAVALPIELLFNRMNNQVTATSSLERALTDQRRDHYTGASNITCGNESKQTQADKANDSGEQRTKTRKNCCEPFSCIGDVRFERW